MVQGWEEAKQLYPTQTGYDIVYSNFQKLVWNMKIKNYSENRVKLIKLTVNVHTYKCQFITIVILIPYHKNVFVCLKFIS